MNNPAVTRLLRWLTAYETLVVFISGFGLFFLPDLLRLLWPWELAPFNTRLMGTIYLASVIPAGILTWKARWSPARVIVPMIFVFTFIVLLVSILYFERFNTANPTTIVWFVLYIGIPANALYHLWLYRKLPPAESTPTPSYLWNILLLQIVIFGGYGIGLLLLPELFSGFWPWRIDDFHGRMYSVGSITPAVGSLLLLRQGSSLEFIALGLTEIIGGIFPIIGLLIVNNSVQSVQWGAAGTWLWLILFLILGVCGMLMLQHAQKIRSVHEIP
jgi:hypothetical protein